MIALDDLHSAPARRDTRLSAGWWVADLLGATLFAACLAAMLGGAHFHTADRLWLLAGIMFSGLLRGGTQGLAALAGQRGAQHTKAALRNKVFTALLPTGLRRGRLVGEDLRTAIDDVEAIEGHAARFRPLRLAATIAPLVVAAIVAAASWVSALILLATLVAFLPGMALAGLAARAESDRQLAALSRLSGLFVDRVRNLPIILAFVVEARVTRQLATSAREVADRTIRVLRIAFLSSAVMEFFAALSVALVAVYCGFSLLGLLPFRAPEPLTLPRAFFALAMAPEFYLAMRRLAAAYHDKQQGEASADAIAVQLGAAATACPAPARAPADIRELAINSLTIAYDDGNRLGPWSADWRGPGLHAIGGETGAGKSSLLHALIGMAPVASGQTLADGQAFVPGACNASIGWAGQVPLLLPGTLHFNLMLGREAIDEVVVAETVRLFGLDALAGRRGLDLAIDPRGSGLSGGERRRIGLARAALSGRSILLLDEPTADLDPASRAQVTEALAELARQHLILAATHDPALIARAASTLVLK